MIRKKRRLFRYVDDVIVVVPDKQDEQTTKDHLLSKINELHLEPNLEKTITYTAEQFLSSIKTDDTLDSLKERYDNLVDSLWNFDENILEEIRQDRKSNRVWWNTVSRLRSCFTELGIFTSDSWISRKLSVEISKNKRNDIRCEFPDLPQIASIAEAQSWASEFRDNNSEWVKRVINLKIDFERLFNESLEVINRAESTPEDIDSAGRRLRFCINRLTLLGLNGINDKLTKLLCETPWIVRDQQRIVADLAMQGFSIDIWNLIEYHQLSDRGMSEFILAISLKAVRFLPLLELAEWEKLINFMFNGTEISKLMATETWLYITAQRDVIPYSDQVNKQTISCLTAEILPSRRLLKNYILILGKLSPEDICELKPDLNSDRLLASALDICSKGITEKVFLEIEPEILRQKYYSAKYYDVDYRKIISPFI